MLKKLFQSHGEFCASHPWEVIVATLTLTACMLSVDKPPSPHVITPPPIPTTHCATGNRNCLTIEDYNAVDVIVMTTIRCIAVLYSYYQFCNLQKLGSKYILGIAGLFTVFSSFVFSSSVINFMGSDISDLKDALFFFLLLIDLSKATLLAQFALSSASHQEVKHNIARGMDILGPTLTLDTIVETLVISVGTLSGVKRLEVLCCFACMSVVVNYVVFMTFYPACLSLILELSRSDGSSCPSWHNKSLIMKALKEEDQKPNPVVQRVKVIMSAGLVVVHAHSRWALRGGDEDSTVLPLVVDNINTNSTEDAMLQGYFMRWVTGSADHIVILILLLALTVKFIFFEDIEELTEQHMSSASASAQESNQDKPTLITVNKSVQTLNNTEPTTNNWSQTDNIMLFALLDKPVQTDTCDSTVKEVCLEDKCVQTGESQADEEQHPRLLEECVSIYTEQGSAESLYDTEVKALVKNSYIPTYQIEKAVNNPERGVGIRRQIVGQAGNFQDALNDLPFRNYDYSKVLGACCENVIGYMPVPVGVAGPLLLDGRLVHVPMATTEGCLVASTNRGTRALLKCGVKSSIVGDGMTRAPVVRFPSSGRASEALSWMKVSNNFQLIKKSFDSTSRFARLTDIKTNIAGRLLFIRFVATTGDAMGMNMLSKGTEEALKMVQQYFPDMEILSISGNFCADKKPAAINWIEGRGKSVVCEATVPSDIVTSVLKTTVSALIDVNINKNLVGSAMAGSIGGFNAHAANIVTAIYIATGQDPAQNVGSSNCITMMEARGKDLFISCTMPSIEVGTVGGGTQLPAQAACLDMLGVKGPNEACPGENANTLARIVCGTVLAGELSLLSALSAGHLVKSHLRHNRSSTNVPLSSKVPTSSPSCAS